MFPLTGFRTSENWSNWFGNVIIVWGTLIFLTITDINETFILNFFLYKFCFLWCFFTRIDAFLVSIKYHFIKISSYKYLQQRLVFNLVFFRILNIDEKLHKNYQRGFKQRWKYLGAKLNNKVSYIDQKYT